MKMKVKVAGCLELVVMETLRLVIDLSLVSSMGFFSVRSFAKPADISSVLPREEP